MALHPQVHKQKLKLQAERLKQRAVIAEARDRLANATAELRKLQPPRKKEVI